MPVTETQDQLFTVRVAAPPPSRGRWRVVVRAPSEAAAAERIAARGHTVLSVAAGCERPADAVGTTRAIPECVKCGYVLKDLPTEETLEVTCPECGTVNLGIELPQYDDKRDERHKFRVIRWFACGVAAVVLLAVIMVIAGAL